MYTKHVMMMVGVLTKVYFPYHVWLLSVILCQGLAQASNYVPHSHWLIHPLPGWGVEDNWKSKSEKICGKSCFFVHSQPTLQEKALALCWHCSAVTKTSLWSQHCFLHESKTQPHTSSYEDDSVPAKTSTSYRLTSGKL